MRPTSQRTSSSWCRPATSATTPATRHPCKIGQFFGCRGQILLGRSSSTRDNWRHLSNLPMVCPRCGKSTPASANQCRACGAAFAQTNVATDVVVPFDTTGLPPGATFGASSGSTAGGQTTVYGTSQSGSAEPPMVPSAAGPLKVGQSFGPRYHIIKLLGAGGMGAVYQAWDSELSVAVAVKVIRVDRRRGSASSEAEKRFKNELLLARQVTHKNVVRIHDLGEIDGIKYITMSYVQGDDLGTVLRRDRSDEH